MHYARAVVILLAVMACSLTVILAFSSAASAQKRGFALVRGPIGGIPSVVLPRAQSIPLPQSGPPACQSTICGSITRYTQTLIVSATEFSYDNSGNCSFEDPGSWSTPSDIQPTKNGILAGSATVNTPPSGIPGPTPTNPDTGTPCQGGGTYYYAPLYFTWNLHANSTAVIGYGPTASFSSEWNGQFGNFSDQTFELTVPVVRPKVEVPTPAGWYDSLSRWSSTLQCCAPPGANGAGGDDDSTFDFTGEMVQEVLKEADSCAAKATVLTGLTATPPNPATWTVGQIYDAASFPPTITSVAANIWGYDNNGYQPCAVQAYRCLKITPCSTTVQQQMQIKSPADSGWTMYTTNSITASINGLIIDNFLKTGIGPLTARRNGVNQWESYLTNRNSCPTPTVKFSPFKLSPTLILFLQQCL
jgi:hypothetical protein